MSLTIIILLILFGLLFLIAEVLFIPGTTVVGILGTLLIGIGIYGVFNMYGRTTGIIAIIATTVFAIILLYFSLSGKTWNRMALHSSIDSKVNELDENAVKIGDVGKTVSKLSPIGKALINDNYYEVRSTGEYIEEDKEVTVIKVEMNKIFVRLS